VVGRNGTGKSTLLRTLAGLEKPLSGEVSMAGVNLSGISSERLARTVAFVSTERIRVTNLKAHDVVALGRSPYTGRFGKLRKEDMKAIEDVLRSVGMSSFRDAAMDTLSDGEAQRVMIARALAQDTPIVLLDEPTAFLDLPNRYEICLLLSRLAREKAKTVIFSSHDLSIVMETADDMMILEDCAVHFGTPAQLLSDGLLSRIFEGTSVGFDSEGHIVLKG
jgi:iron complex transport system ATP-binding protein